MNPTVLVLLQKEISLEGGFSNQPADAGGATNMGITQRTLSTYMGRQASIDDVRNLSVDQAEEIYYRNYYLKPRFDSLPTGLQSIAVDTGILHGPAWSIQIMQQIVNQAGFGPIDQDGVLGPQSQGAITKAYVAMGPYFTNAFVEERVSYYKDRVANDPSQQVFLIGWINRAESFSQPIPGVTSN